MKTEPSLVDYCKYGPNADKINRSVLLIQAASPGPVIIQGTK